MFKKINAFIDKLTIQRNTEPGYGNKEVKKGDAVVTYNFKHKQVHISFHQENGGAIIPFKCVKGWYEKIIKAEEIGLTDNTE